MTNCIYYYIIKTTRAEKQIQEVKNMKQYTNSLHFDTERQTRENCIKNIIGEGKMVAKFEVDRGHRNGPEFHVITDTGIIEIYNKRSGKLITKLIARAGQITRYFRYDNSFKKLYDNANIKQLKHLADEHENRGYNLL